MTAPGDHPAHPDDRLGGPDGIIGRTIAGYRVEKELGRGGMAVVYRATDLRLGRTVALKLMGAELARNETFRNRFTHESRVAAAIDHPHIVPIFDAGEAEGVLYIAMCYVPGEDLRALIDRNGRLSPATTVRIARQLASALDAAHARDLVHRDVKPGNVLVAKGTDPDHPEHVYLTDFGLTKKSLSLTGYTRVGQIIGTADYMAPEQISGQPVDGRCDVYSLACVVHEMLTGSPPFRRDDDRAVLFAHMAAPPPKLSEQVPELPEAVDEVFSRALAKSPEERFDSCLEFVSALRRAATPTGDTPTGAPRPPSGGPAGTGTPYGPPPAPPAWAAPAFPERDPTRRTGGWQS
ncbi:hypothetical protein GCM10010218_46000 [Streptomyces mashuensis]|uniref:non-specific serine/threonine protein kinase n=1 Tax=Streptomyces mashuensis TaxID=33904 RepID=A0A919B5E7_9ACTN|nr:serine/threonine-protein kinase [Streptomyces mashuensis]GHF59312.1 hypothetical protein GCM10010218_46000 [Streptomyces mashuensis]